MMMSHSRIALAMTVCAVIAACDTLRFVDVPTENQSSRVDYLVIHFTGESFVESMRLLTERTDNPVSAHYLVPESGDSTYPQKRLRVYRLVDEEQRAWHAGDSYWHDEEALNADSIGIEIVNQSHCVDIDLESEPKMPENQRCVFRDFDPEQLELVIELVNDILDRYPRIAPVDIVGHADIAPSRRVDPGPRFPWRTLHERGIGAWYDDATVAKYREQFQDQPLEAGFLQRALNAYGYRVEESGENDPQTRFALRAFQMHFRPSDWSGQADAETAAILLALIEKYRPEALGDLLSGR
jgi:N-acetyl-anhydromuramyl-L-alanine amidase AmpD